jgi:hypothetical protein
MPRHAHGERLLEASISATNCCATSLAIRTARSSSSPRRRTAESRRAFGHSLAYLPRPTFSFEGFLTMRAEAAGVLRAHQLPFGGVRETAMENRYRPGTYTGQTRDEVRQQLLQDPPHILLTNYVML